MINGFIQLSAVLSQMEELDEKGQPVRFQIKFVTANRKLNTGGKIIEIKNGGTVLRSHINPLPIGRCGIMHAPEKIEQ